MTDELNELLHSQAQELLTANAMSISEELKTAEDGKLSVSIGFKMALIGQKLIVTTAIAFSRKFKDETEGMVELTDPQQPELLPRRKTSNQE